MGLVKIRPALLFRRVFFFLLIPFTACAPMAEIDIRVLEPAQVTLPAYVNQLAFMNRSLYPYVIFRDSSKWSKEELIILDTIMNNRIFMGVRSSMSESPLYELDSIEVIQNRRTDTTDLLSPLRKPELRKFKEAYEADALLSLEYYNITDSVKVGSGILDGWYYKAYMGLNSTTVWRIYDLTVDSVFDTYILMDTIAWYGFDDGYKSALSRLPKAINAIRDAAYNIGYKYGYYISPIWVRVPRFYYSRGKKKMRLAGKQAAAGDWEEATRIWKELAYEENEKASAKASYNMAVVCEMEDLLIPALDWAIKSYSIKQKDLTKEYIEVLQIRHMQRKKLERQVPILNVPEQ